MKWSKKVIAMLLIVLIVPVLANQFVIAKEWDFQPIDDVNKAWEIKFNIPLDEKSINAESVYILDGKGKHPASLRLTGNRDTVQVVPTIPYVIGKEYMVMITVAVKSADGKSLATSVEVPFRVVGPTEKILSVQNTTDIGFGTTLTVIASPDVYSVKVGTELMDYRGNNRYTLTLSDVKPGTSKTIYAYDENVKSLGNQRYIIK